MEEPENGCWVKGETLSKDETSWTLPNWKTADDNFNFDENGKKFSRKVENAVRKGEIARYEQFLLFPQRFQMTYTADT